MREWADVVAFATDDVAIKKADVGFNATVARGHSTGKRSLRLVERPALPRQDDVPAQTTQRAEVRGVVLHSARRGGPRCSPQH